MASFVNPASGESTTDAGVHLFKWVVVSDDDLSKNLKEIQPWITTTTMNGTVWYAWADLVVEWLEFGVTGDAIAPRLALAEVIGPAAVVRGLLTILDPMPKEALTRSQFARLARHRARRLPEAGVAEITLRVADLIPRPTLYLPAWQHITYAEADSMGGGMFLSWWYFYDSESARGQSDASFLLNQVRAFAVTQGLLAENLLPPRPPLPIPDPVASATAGAPPVNQDAIEAALAAAEHDRRMEQPDAIDPQTVRFAVLDLAAYNPFQIDYCYRSEAMEGPPRRAAATMEVASLRLSIGGGHLGVRARLQSIVSAAIPEGEVNHLLTLTRMEGDVLQPPSYAPFLKDLAQILLPSEAAKEEVLLTPQGIRTLNVALSKHAAFIDHQLNTTSSEGDHRPSTRDVLEWLTRRTAENPAVVGGSLAYAASNPAAAASVNVAGSAGKGLNNAAYFAAAQKPENAQVMIWVASITADPASTSVDVHQAIFVVKNTDHPTWVPTGFLHALGWGTINAAVIDPKLAAVYEYSSNKYIGIYLCYRISHAMQRARLLTEEQVSYLKGFSLEELAKAVRSNDWSKLDVVNLIDYEIQRKLAEMTWLDAPAATPFELTLTDTAMVTRATCLIKALFEAFGMQRDGDLSIAKLCTDLNTEVIANTAMPTKVLTKMIEANVAIYQYAFTLAGRDYAACRGATNVHMLLPPTNYKREDLQPHLDARTRKMEQLHKVMVEMGARKQIGADVGSFDASQGGVEAAVAAIRSGYYAKTKAGKATGSTATDAEAKRQREAEGAEAETKKAKLEKEKADKEAARKAESAEKSRAKRAADAAAFDAATCAPIEGLPPNQTLTFGTRTFDFHALTEKWGTDRCWPAIIAYQCGADHATGLKYARKCCPQNDTVHPDGCAEHTAPSGFKLSEFRTDKPKPASGKGKGGKSGGGGKGKGKNSKKKGGGKGKGKNKAK